MATSSILEKHVTAPFLLQRNTASVSLILLLRLLMVLPVAKPVIFFSLDKILFKVGVKQNIPLLVSMAQEYLDASPVRRPTTTTGIMATLASIISH